MLPPSDPSLFVLGDLLSIPCDTSAAPSWVGRDRSRLPSLFIAQDEPLMSSPPPHTHTQNRTPPQSPPKKKTLHHQTSLTSKNKYNKIIIILINIITIYAEIFSNPLNQCSTTGVTKAVVCAVLSVRR